MENKNLLITGGAGFIGSNFVNLLFEKHDSPNIVVLDKLTYAGEKSRLEPYLDEIEFIKGDISDKNTVKQIFSSRDIDYVVNFAAESHVDRSIESGDPFVKSNVRGAYTLMDVAREQNIEKFIQISTDEVYGSIKNGKAKEGDSLNPSSPYSASKASADVFANSFYVTYNLPVIIVRPTNNFGPKQHKEKLIPKFIVRAERGEKLPIYGDGTNVRDWLYVKDNCRAIELLMRKGKPGETYNIGADNHKTNLEVVQKILELTDNPESLIEFVEDRKGHDQRYAVDSEKIRSMGWNPQSPFENVLKETIAYYTG
ncbi:MAG: dTDP-glucose 4,6-dehydratase [Candidatus Nanohaloarchaea archaeon]